MRIYRYALLVLLSLVWVGVDPGFLGAATTPDFVTLSEQLKPAVVNINTSKTVQSRRPALPGLRGPQSDLFEDFFEHFFQGQPNRSRQQRSLGSGFIISADGYILTNHHVVNDADEIKVKLADGRSFTAELQGGDSKLDLALLKIDTGSEKLPVASLGNSESLKVGEWVMAIGNPFGLAQTVTVGIVSAKGRVIGAGPYDDFIQTDASINPGNSGGPLFNVRGEVVGINTAIVAGGQGIGFAIPVDIAKDVIAQLRETGQVVRGWLGVMVQAMTEELAASFGLKQAKGALVTEVVSGSPAEKAGVLRGDVILSVNGRVVDELNDLPKQVAALPVGESAQITVFRDGKKRRLEVMIARLSDETEIAEGGSAIDDKLGLGLVDLSPELQRRYRLEDSRGALVAAITPGGPGATAGLQVGDLIIEADGRVVVDVASLRRMAAKVPAGKVLRLLLQRRNQLLYTVIKVP
ncbi:peptidase [Syntrophotalea acetylenivorans]|uniref:Probable periplasmic serine endoprotease DegP-like n=1 Tax=Syntrophotalea acetylenivorans TaxID=1842532 RepID=A0A1L3GRF9_9BACT|nr:DegQ family serine endoprotease [Syntrophotalea acetylenivorans]APG28529.1 peptidase [Syntrophotalea acetylenivorans]